MESDLSEKKRLESSISVNSVGSPALHSVISPSGKVVEIGDEAHLDQALAFVQNHGRIEVSKAEDNRVCRKVDLILMPLFCMLYMVQFMDKTVIGFTVIMGIKKDYHMVGEMYSWTNSGFYLGYVFGSPFSAFLLQKLPTVKFVSCIIILWGLIQCLHCVPKTYGAFMFLRTFLGFLESFITPIFVIILNQYYRYNEHFGRTGVFYGFNGLGTIFLSGVSYGLYKYKDSYSMEAYKILFLIVGLMTIVLGFIIALVVPNTPTEAKWLSDREKQVIIERIRDNNQGFGNKKFKWDQFFEVFKDPRSYIYFLLSLSVAIPNGGVSGFGTLILKSFGYSNLESLLMKMPLGACELVGLVALPFLSKFVQQRMILALFYMSVVVMSVCLLAFATTVDQNASLAGYYILGIAPVGIILITSCVTSNTAGFTKKLVTNAITLIGYSAGNVIGPQTFRSTDAPDYNKAKAGCVGCYCATIVLMVILTILNIRENKKRDKSKAEAGDAYVVPENLEFADLTDFQNPEFRYRL
ncbi:hypothetical protein DAMA08_034130 [Martiniozyma asiatica (nom. inval.)]|nr:hypothetical protein DAMA08_034130 [Martiniozyma asiatica]